MSPILLALLVAQGAQLSPLPIGPAEPLLTYMSCLMEPAALRVDAGLPTDRTAREAMAQEILNGCANVRSSVAGTAFDRSETLPTVTDQQARRDLIEAYLQHFEQGMRHMVVEFEAFAAESDAYEACLDEGRSEC